MRKQNCRVLSKCGSFTVRWFSPAEAQTAVDQGQAKIVSRNPMRIQLIAPADLSRGSKPSRAMLGHADAALLATIKPGFIERLDAARVADMRPSTVAGLQRLSGWGLLPRNATLENYGE